MNKTNKGVRAHSFAFFAVKKLLGSELYSKEKQWKTAKKHNFFNELSDGIISKLSTFLSINS